MEAVCSQDHIAPGPNCHCGLHAARTLAQLVDMSYHKYGNDHFTVVGEISLWGRLIEGTQGWRGQYGYPRRLFVPFEAWTTVTEPLQAYGVAIIPRNIPRLKEEER